LYGVQMAKDLIEHSVVSIDDLIPYALNSRTHSDAQVAQIAASISEFGFLNPIIVDGENGIIAGHGRVLAARKLGKTHLPVVQAKHLTEAQKKAYVIADNRLALNAGWDTEILSTELTALQESDFDLELLGFDSDELAKLLEPETVDGLTDEDEVPDVPDDPITKPGDVWIIGNHRLMCGDSTSIDAVERLMDGRKADMVFTDPPYNIDYQGLSGKWDKIKNDKMSDSDFVDFLSQSLMGCEIMYVCCSWHYGHLFRQAMINIARQPKAMIVWDKVNPAQNLDKYFKQHEIIFYYGDYGGTKTLRGDVWTLKRQKNTIHPTMKPVELIDIAINDNPTARVVYDGFGGSGSTMISCEKNSRHCMMIEMEPKYCDVIINRWQDFTGKQAILESSGDSYNDMIANGRKGNLADAGLGQLKEVSRETRQTG
jgi:DNA modification methylase